MFWIFLNSCRGLHRDDTLQYGGRAPIATIVVEGIRQHVGTVQPRSPRLAGHNAARHAIRQARRASDAAGDGHPEFGTARHRDIRRARRPQLTTVSMPTNYPKPSFLLIRFVLIILILPKSLKPSHHGTQLVTRSEIASLSDSLFPDKIVDRIQNKQLEPFSNWTPSFRLGTNVDIQKIKANHFVLAPPEWGWGVRIATVDVSRVSVFRSIRVNTKMDNAVFIFPPRVSRR